MELETIKEQKGEIEAQISLMIKNFEDATGCIVYGIKSEEIILVVGMKSTKVFELEIQL